MVVKPAVPNAINVSFRSRCHLLYLPAELRLMVYEFVLHSTFAERRWTSAAEPLLYPLLRTSKQLTLDAESTYISALHRYHDRLQSINTTVTDTTIRALELHLTYARWLLGSFDGRSRHEFVAEIKLRDATERLDADRLGVAEIVRRRQEEVERELNRVEGGRGWNRGVVTR